MQISADRLLADLAELAAIGARAEGGVDRVAGSEADLAARHWLAGRLREAGLAARFDEAMNVFGRLPRSAGRWLLVGSHTDTVPAGGRLDGAYGVIAAFEVLRTLHDAGHPAAAAVEVVSFADEEGVSGPGLTGSSALCESPHLSELLGYLELHIEQGPRLEAEGLELGVVEGIVGIDRWDVRILGEANHAGTTPFHLRRDAERAAARVIAALRELVQQVNAEMVANVGELALVPGAPNVVPGEAAFVVELRALEAGSLAGAARGLRDELERVAGEEGCSFSATPRPSIPPAPLDGGVVAALSRVCERSRRPWRRLVSGAGHDAGMLAHHVPSGMLFVPSRGGISHSPREHTDDRLLVQGAQLLLEGVLEVLAGAGNR